MTSLNRFQREAEPPLQPLLKWVDWSNSIITFLNDFDESKQYFKLLFSIEIV